MQLPTLWEKRGLPFFDGILWYAIEVNLEKEDLVSNAVLNLGPIDDSDITFFNGKEVGRTEDAYAKPRRYIVPKELLKVGKNTLMVRVDDLGGGGGLYGAADQLFLQVGNKKIPLAGDWKYTLGPGEVNMQKASPNDYPAQLYHGMIYPLLKLKFKGVIWYQGESNADRSVQYAETFQTMIKSWRKKLDQPELPFYFVQLASFMPEDKAPITQGWQELREAQYKTLALPNTGMAVTTDIGDAYDIHPRNKQEVGLRLAKWALAKDYGQSVVYSGPQYKGHTVKGDSIIVSFDFLDNGLVTTNKYGYVQGFAIAGADQKFYWAKAFIKDNQVVLYAPEVKAPVAVRFAWSANTDDANLYNTAGLPACPFRTDDWELATKDTKYKAKR